MTTKDKDAKTGAAPVPAPEKPPHEGAEVVQATEPPPIAEREPEELPDLGGKID